MTLRVNGESREVPEESSLESLVVSLGLPPQGVLIEHNGAALRREEWGGRTLRDGDRLEIIRIVAGG